MRDPDYWKILAKSAGEEESSLLGGSAQKAFQDGLALTITGMGDPRRYFTKCIKLLNKRLSQLERADDYLLLYFAEWLTVKNKLEGKFLVKLLNKFINLKSKDILTLVLRSGMRDLVFAARRTKLYDFSEDLVRVDKVVRLINDTEDEYYHHVAGNVYKDIGLAQLITGDNAGAKKTISAAIALLSKARMILRFIVSEMLDRLEEGMVKEKTEKIRILVKQARETGAIEPEAVGFESFDDSIEKYIFKLNLVAIHQLGAEVLMDVASNLHKTETIPRMTDRVRRYFGKRINPYLIKTSVFTMIEEMEWVLLAAWLAEKQGWRIWEDKTFMLRDLLAGDGGYYLF